MRTVFIVCAFVALCSVGCKVGPNHCDPGAPIQEYWRHANGEEMTDEWSDVADWWYNFEDDTLNALIAESASQNLTLEEASRRVLEARFQRGVVRADLFPQFTGNGDYTFQKTPISGGFFSQLGPAANLIDVSIDNFTLGITGGWDMDVWGRLKRNVEAAEADIGASVWAYRDTMVILMADVATAYVDARAFKQRIEVAQNNEARQFRSYEIQKLRDEAGLEFGLLTNRLLANYKTTEAEEHVYEIGYQQALNRLSVLLGRPPGYVDQIMSESAPIPEAKHEVAIGIPAELIRRRPDVRVAERELAAQTARIGVAIADLYPQFTISGTFGVTAQTAADLFTTNGFQANVGPAMSWNLLNFGRIRFNVNVQEERAIQSLLRYENSVLLAAEEVDNALVSYDQEKQRLVVLGEAVEAFRKAADIAERRLVLEDEQNLIDVQRELFRSEDSYIVSKANVTKNLINIYRALGGGWEWSSGNTYVQGVIEEFPDVESLPDGMPQDNQGGIDGVPMEEPIPLDGAQPSGDGIPMDGLPMDGLPMDNTLPLDGAAPNGNVQSWRPSDNRSDVSQQLQLDGMLNAASRRAPINAPHAAQVSVDSVATPGQQTVVAPSTTEVNVEPTREYSPARLIPRSRSMANRLRPIAGPPNYNQPADQSPTPAARVAEEVGTPRN